MNSSAIAWRGLASLSFQVNALQYSMIGEPLHTMEIAWVVAFHGMYHGTCAMEPNMEHAMSCFVQRAMHE